MLRESTSRAFSRTILKKPPNFEIVIRVRNDSWTDGGAYILCEVYNKMTSLAAVDYL
jgi:hypothetical protein